MSQSTAPKNDGTESQRQASKFVRGMRKVYRPFGFSKGYNFSLFVIFGGAMLGFCLARTSYLNVGGSAQSSFANGSAPGEWYHYHKGHYRIGITLHLATIIPAGILMVFQFLPIIRHKAILFHRINGYIVILLMLFSHIGVLMIARRTFGGTLDIQAAVGTVAILNTISIAMATYNIKRLQIEQHRAWMLRAMFYAGTIITLRIIMILSAVIISSIKSYDQIQTCGQVAFVRGLPQDMLSTYPQCANASSDTKILVQADIGGNAENAGASLGLSFGMAWWLAILLHLIGVEIYLNLTPMEAERLRMVSYERQLEAGYENPGSSGLTVDRWGDSKKWEPASSANPR